MRRSKTLISQALSTLKGNMDHTGDPLGFRSVYWADWINGIDLPRRGDTVLLTARMYQMLPFVVQATEMAAAAKLLLPIFSVKAFSRMAEMAGRLAGEPLLRIRARSAKELRKRGADALSGIARTLVETGAAPAYLYEDEPYSGALLYDLGLEKEIAPHVRNVYSRLKSKGVRTVITVDPHTTFMLREIFPKYIPGYDLKVRHYLDLLSENTGRLADIGRKLPDRFVMHDSCVMTRDLGIIEQARRLTAGLGIQLVEPENTKLNTACCGGPVEYAYTDLSRSISGIRARELAGSCKDVLVTCPICLINLMKHEKAMGIRVWDMGEILHCVTTG